MFDCLGDDPFGFKEIRDEHKKMAEEFKKLCVEPSSKVPVAGDRVVVAVGLLSMGHLWCREEGRVLEVGDTSVHVELIRYGEPTRVWIHPVLITDVIGQAATVM